MAINKIRSLRCSDGTLKIFHVTSDGSVSLNIHYKNYTKWNIYLGNLYTRKKDIVSFYYDGLHYTWNNKVGAYCSDDYYIDDIWMSVPDNAVIG